MRHRRSRRCFVIEAKGRRFAYINRPEEEPSMATVIVRSDHDHAILMSEQVLPDHLDDDHSAVQLLERLAWAIEDAHGQARRRTKLVARQQSNRTRALRRLTTD